jgi:hypothetical protein
MKESFERIQESHTEGTRGLRQSHGISVLVVGAGRVGAKVLLQLRKNPNLNVVTLDPRDEPFAIQEGILSYVDYQRELTPGDIISVIEKVAPELVLVTTSRDDIGRSGVPGLEVLVEALWEELEATANVPIIAVSRTGIG